MKSKKKVLVTLLCAALLVFASVMGTMAYLTDTKAVKNTFTVGNVAITLDEAPVGDDGKVIDGNRVTENTYKLFPGHEYDKDPVVHVGELSENCWLFVTVDNQIAGVIDNSNTIESQMNENGWRLVNNEKYPGVYAYKMVATKGQDVPVFEGFKVAGTMTNDTLKAFDGKTIVVNAYAIQADGFGSAEIAWEKAGAEAKAN